MSFLTRLIRKPWSLLRSHPYIGSAILIAVLLVGSGVWAIITPAPPQYVTAVAVRGDAVQTVEAVGTVISDRDLSLKFPVSGTVGEVLVKEGDTVTQGQVLARLRNQALAADVSAAAARLQGEQANLRELEEGSRPEDIAITEAQLLNARAQLLAAETTLKGAEEKLKTSEAKLSTLREQARTALAGNVLTASSDTTEQLSTVASALLTLQDIFVVNPDVGYLSRQQFPSRYDVFVTRWKVSEQGIADLRVQVPAGFDNFEEALRTMDSARATLAISANVFTEAEDLIQALPLTSTFTQSTRETYRTTLSTKKAAVQTAVSTLDSTLKSLRDASASFDTQIASEENLLTSAQATKDSAESDIRTLETTVQTQEAQLNLKRAGTRPTAIAAAKSRVQQMAADLARAQAQLEETILRAPIDGTVTEVGFKVGELTADSANLSHVIGILGTSPMRIEVFASEVDIPKIALSQSGSIELDAYPGEAFPLRVSEVDPASTEVDGVPKYRLVLDFVSPPTGLKIGMTGDTEVVTGRRLNVVLIPARAVIERDDGTQVVRVLTSKGEIEETPVETGLETDTDVEVLSGIEEGQTVILLIKP